MAQYKHVDLYISHILGDFLNHVQLFPSDLSLSLFEAPQMALQIQLIAVSQSLACKTKSWVTKQPLIKTSY